MTDNDLPDAPGATPSDHDPVRRLFLSAMTGTLAAAGLAGSRSARAAEEGKKQKVFDAYNRQRAFTKDEMNGTPFVASQFGNFDLTDPVQNNLARLKMTTNLIGKRTYIPMLIRLSIAREELPGGPLLGGAGMFTWQMQEPDPKEFPNVPKGTAVMRSMYTVRYLDPKTMEPVEYLKNPYTGKMMHLQDYLFIETFLSYPKGGSVDIQEPQFANDAADKPVLHLMKKWGDELVLIQGGVYSKPGPHQPRFTENIWSSPYADVMNPDKSLVETRYDFNGINKAWEKPWAGYTMKDKDSLTVLAYGRKYHSVEDLPEFHKRVLVEKYPDRV